MKEYIEVLATFGKKEEAELVLKKIMDKRLAACIQIMPIKSIYWWRDEINRADEYLCLIKTKKRVYKEVEKTIKENNSYEIPEIIALPIIYGNKDYLEWIDKEVK